MVQRWVFFDPSDSTTQTFEVNPNAGGSPPQNKNIASRSTVAVGGKNINFEGAKQPDIITFSGLIYDKTMLDIFTFWFNKRHQIRITDDLSRVMVGFITKFEAKRVRFGHYFWRHQYTVTFEIVNWS